MFVYLYEVQPQSKTDSKFEMFLFVKSFCFNFLDSLRKRGCRKIFYLFKKFLFVFAIWYNTQKYYVEANESNVLDTNVASDIGIEGNDTKINIFCIQTSSGQTILSIQSKKVNIRV